MIHAFTAYPSRHITRAAHQLLLCAQSHVCVVASSYKACVGDGREVFSLSWNAPFPHAPVHVGSPAGSPAMDAERWVTPEQENLSGGEQGVQIHACFIAWTERGEEHKWHWGEEVRNIILKCTDKSACASTDSYFKHLMFPLQTDQLTAPHQSWHLPPAFSIYAHKLASRNPKTQSWSENAHIPKTANRPVLCITWVRATWGHSQLVKFYYLCICLAQYSIAPFDVNCGCCSHREMNRRSVVPTTLSQDKEECTAKDSIWR